MVDLKKYKGITLISLVITIVIMLILAGVSLNFILNNNGLFNKTQVATTEYNKKAVKEELENALASLNLDVNEELTNEKIVNDLPKELSSKLKWTSNDNLEGIYKNYAFKIENGKIIMSDSVNDENILNYSNDNLALEYDGEYNTFDGHDNTINTWQDISGNNYNGTFKSQLNPMHQWNENCYNIINNTDSNLELNTNYNIPEKTCSICFTIDGTNFDSSILLSTGDENNYLGYVVHNNFCSKRGPENANISVECNLGTNGIKDYVFIVSNEKIKLYINGALYKETNNEYGLSSSNCLKLFNSYYTTNQSVNNLKLYNFRIYEKELNNDEIQKNYQTNKKRFDIQEIDKSYLNYSQDGLILHYDGKNNTLNGHSNTTSLWNDLSLANNNGTTSVVPTRKDFKWEDSSLSAINNSSCYVTTPLNTSNTNRTICFTIDGTDNSGGIFSTSDSDNATGYFVYCAMKGSDVQFFTNRKKDSTADYIYYKFNKTGIYNYTITMDTSYFTLYCNGVKIEQVANKTGLVTANNIKLFGTSYHDAQYASNLKIYNFKVYNKVLSQTEIDQNVRVDNQRIVLTQ